MESIRQIRESNLLKLAKLVSDEEAMLLQRISHRLHQLDEVSCNYGLTEQQEKRVYRLKRQAQEIAEKHNLNAYHQGDPRGWSLYLVPSDMKDLHANYDKGFAICPH